jgi:hypothetical protein
VNEDSYTNLGVNMTIQEIYELIKSYYLCSSEDAIRVANELVDRPELADIDLTYDQDVTTAMEFIVDYVESNGGLEVEMQKEFIYEGKTHTLHRTNYYCQSCGKKDVWTTRLHGTHGYCLSCMSLAAGIGVVDTIPVVTKLYKALMEDK